LTAAGGDPVAIYLGNDTGGGWAVSLFFVISGYLVSRSLAGRGGFEYLKARFLRIVPGLAVASLFTVVLGAFYTTLPLVEYLRHPLTHAHLMNWRLFPVTWGLPGVFEGNPSLAANGSLWTLPVEAFFYLLLPVLAAFALFNRYLAAIAYPSLLLLFFLLNGIGLDYVDQGGEVFPGVPLLWSVRMAIMFSAGTLFFFWGDHITLSWPTAAILSFLLVLAPRGAVTSPIYFIALPYLVMWLGTMRSWPLVSRYQKLDLSYGTYLYAYPVQQAIVAASHQTLGPYWLTVSATPIVLILAFLSWSLVEKPSLRLKGPWRRRE